MAKDILLFLDGTRNAAQHQLVGADTNVLKLFEAVLSKNTPAGPVAHYIEGVGSEGAPSPLHGLAYAGSPPARFESAAKRIPETVRELIQRASYVPNDLESATGWGIALQIQRAYSILCEHYQAGDRVYLLGFSRGAFAARSLAGFADQVGLLLQSAALGKDREYLVSLAYELYRTGRHGYWAKLRWFLRYMTGASKPQPGDGPQSTVLPVYFVGVWDTVDALGLEPLGLDNSKVPLVRSHTLHHVAESVPSNVTHARHAIALHELRESFEPVLWKSYRTNQTLKQVWFPGAHADVGGGYPDALDPPHSLHWMAAEMMTVAKKGGSQLQLAHLPGYQPLLCYPSYPPHHEMQGVFQRKPPVVRAALEKRTVLPEETICTMSVHPSSTVRLFDAEATDYAWYPYMTQEPHHDSYPTEVRKALQRVDDRSIELHLTLVLRAQESALDASATWHRARTQSDLREARELVDQLLPRLQWRAEETLSLANALALISVFCAWEFVNKALEAIEVRAERWNNLSKSSRFNGLDLRRCARVRSGSLFSLLRQYEIVLPTVAGFTDERKELTRVWKFIDDSANAFPWKPLRLASRIKFKL